MLVFSYTTLIAQTSLENDEHIHHVHELHEVKNDTCNAKKVCAYSSEIVNVIVIDSLKTNALSMIDILSSDENSDVNCSAGFCMTKSHNHKRGLTTKKQLFHYFINISC
ncbi:hypothetical protein ACFSTE_20805 [Aquimarina hainanensis]|uniref:Uncharacterized protein n=1 Tax=Aquimarina hainanensis TaxID=1578017 RepID=A0ABW5NCV5_9FLAO